MNREKYESNVKFHPKVGDKLRVNSTYSGGFFSARVIEVTTKKIVTSKFGYQSNEFDRVTLKNKEGCSIQTWSEEDDLYLDWCRSLLATRNALEKVRLDFEGAISVAVNAKRVHPSLTKERMDQLTAMANGFREAFLEELTK